MSHCRMFLHCEHFSRHFAGKGGSWTRKPLLNTALKFITCMTQRSLNSTGNGSEFICVLFLCSCASLDTALFHTVLWPVCCSRTSPQTIAPLSSLYLSPVVFFIVLSSRYHRAMTGARRSSVINCVQRRRGRGRGCSRTPSASNNFQTARRT